ncbi:MAG: PDZ domain-containing protein [Bacteriovoracaceae bacterium]
MYYIIQLLLLVGLLNSCGHQQTNYHPLNKAGGYSDKFIFGDYLGYSQFNGNAYTKKSRSETFSNLRAIDVCYQNNYKLSYFIGTVNLTTEKTVTKSSSYSNVSPGQTYKGMVLTPATISSGTEIWDETYTFPTYATFFLCGNEIYILDIEVKAISIDDMKPFVKDLMGAVQITTIIENSPNSKSLSVGDIITKINGKRIQNILDMLNVVHNSKDKNRINVEIFREGEKKSLTLSAINISKKVKEENEEIYSIKVECSWYQRMMGNPNCIHKK